MGHSEEFVSHLLDIEPDVPEMIKILLADAQTSGGLLVALPEKQAAEAIKDLVAAGISSAAVIGKIIKGNSRIRLK